jgi:hypothetical protein
MQVTRVLDLHVAPVSEDAIPVVHAGQEKIPIVLVSARADLSAVARRVGTPYFLAKASANYGDVVLELVARALRERRAPEAPTVTHPDELPAVGAETAGETEQLAALNELHATIGRATRAGEWLESCRGDGG